MEPWEKHLVQWETAGVVDAATGERIRAFEAAQVNPARQRWQVVVALIFGGILLGAGVLLFVAAHWDEVSPTGRFLLVVGVLAALHVGAVLTRADSAVDAQSGCALPICAFEWDERLLHPGACEVAVSVAEGQELWALVTVPPSGPVRPVKLAVSDSSGFHVE